MFLQLQEHLQFAVRQKTRQNAGSVIVVKQLSAKLKVQFIIKRMNSFHDMFRLHFQICIIIKRDFFHVMSSPFHKYFCYYNKNKDIYQEDHKKRKRKHDEAGKQKMEMQEQYGVP